jgi:hypothetical protein
MVNKSSKEMVKLNETNLSAEIMIEEEDKEK